jgi:putative ABC transport system permease protein
MRAIAQRQAELYPDTNKGWQLRPLLLRDFVTGNLTRQYTILLLGAVGFVLLIACADVANVQFARMSGRETEFAVRAALGGSRWRVVRQLLTESILMSLAGAAVGLFLAQWSLTLILSHMPADVARYVAGWKYIRLDADAFVFTFAIALASGIVSGVAPSLLSSRTNLSEALKESGRSSTASRTKGRLRNALVVAEVSLALVLLVGAGLLVRNFRGLLAVNESYSPQTLLTMNLVLHNSRYATPAGRLSFHEQTLQRLRTVPGVQSATLVTDVPYANGGGASTDFFSIEGRPLTQRGELRNAFIETVAPNYFSTLNIGLRQGRTLSDSDGVESLPAAVISASLAERYFPGENPLGRRIKVGKDDSELPWMTVVGVVNDVHYSWIDKHDIPTVYRSFRQAPPYYTTLVLRTTSEFSA